MLYLLNKDVRTVRWNGEPLHEATSAIVKEIMNGDFTLTVKYPISDSGIYQLIQEDMLIKAPTPVLGAQLFRIKKPVEHNDHLEITAYHISDDVMQRSITPMSVTSQSCGMALSRMVQNTKTALGDFSFNSDIQDRRTFNTTETETLYSVLLDGKHSIVGTWEGELVRDNFSMTVKKSRGENRGVVITTHKNLKDYQRTKNSQNVVTRIHAKSTFKPEGAEKETTIRVTVDSPLINSYPYINEKEYENNNAKSAEELQKWAQAKFTNQGIDKVSDAIKIEAFELDGQVVHMGDTVNLKSWKHNVDAFKKAIAYEFDALKEGYISLTFDDKAGVGGSRASGGLSSAADAILGVTESAQEIALEKALQNADLDFDHKAGLLRQEISDGIELAKARAEEVKRQLSDTIDQRFSSFNSGPLQEAKRRSEEALQNAGASSLLAQEAKRIGLDSVARLEEFKRQATSAQTTLSGAIDALKQTIANDIRPKQAQAEAEIAKQVEALVQTKKELASVKSAQATYEETTTRRLAELTNLANGKASKSELTQTAEELASRIASVRVGGRNYYRDSEKIRTSTRFFSFPLHLYLTQENVGETWTLSFDLKINEGGEIRPLHFYHYQNNRFGLKASADITPSKEWQRFTFTGPVIFPNDDTRYSRGEMALYDYGGNNNYSVRRIKLEKGTLATDWSPAIEDTDGQISAVESNFKQRADALDAGVRRLTEGLRTKADISSLNVTAENIRQSVKSLETDTQDKLNQKLSLAEFEVRAGSIRQEILNATKDKADKTLVVAEAGKLRTELSTVQEYVKNDGQRQESLQRYARDESARQVSAVREQISRDYVGKSAYQEDVRGLERRFSAISTQTNNDIATKIAQYKQTVDGQFASITSQIAGKANQVDFQRVRETSQLYERILGNTENGIADKVARMAMTNQLFQVEVGKAFAEHQNLFLNSTLTKGFLGNNGIINVANATQKEVTSDFISVDPNEKIIFQHWVTLPENGMAWTAWQFFDKNKNPIDNRKPGLNAYKTTVGKQHNINQITIPANAYFVRFSARMYDDGLIKVEKGSAPSDYSVAPNDALEAVKTVQRQLDGSWSVQNINGVGSIVSQINATNNQILIEAEKIRLKGKTLLDELTAIQGYFKRLFVGDASVGTLNSDIIKSNSITADKLVMDMAMARRFVSSDIFTDTLAAKEAFINKLRSVVVTATFLEGFQGKIGGFRFGQYTNRNGYFITGINSVSIGMGNGTNAGANRNAFWANWGESLDTPGPKAWYVNTDGKMYCRNDVDFYSKVDFASTSKVNFYSKINAPKGIWIASDDVNGEGDNPAGGYNAVVWWSQIVTGKFRQHAGITTGSDRKLKENIEPTPVKALDKINALNLVAFDYIKDKTHEEIGLIAQEVLNIIPGSVEKYEGEDNHLTINYSKFVPYLIKAIQELNEKIEEMEKTVA